MEYISLSWYDIPELVVPIRISLTEGCCLTRKLLNQGFLLVTLKSSLRKFYSHDHNLVDRYGISVSQMTKDMLHLSQTLPGSFPEHLSSPQVLCGVCVTWWWSLVLCVCFGDHCLSFCTFSFGHCVVCCTDSDYPFGIFKLFLALF